MISTRVAAAAVVVSAIMWAVLVFSKARAAKASPTWDQIGIMLLGFPVAAWLMMFAITGGV